MGAYGEKEKSLSEVLEYKFGGWRGLVLVILCGGKTFVRFWGGGYVV